jgi:hypothetical protein
MTEARFFRSTAIAAAVVVVGLVIWARLGARALPHILPFGMVAAHCRRRTPRSVALPWGHREKP